jgi:ribonuclease HI
MSDSCISHSIYIDCERFRSGTALLTFCPIADQAVTSKERIILYCDGACSGNQSANNVGGWGAVLKYKERTKEISGGEHNTSNQRMELTACIRGLETITSKDIPIDVYSDSAYLINCMREKWYVTWQKNGWKNAKKQSVENQDLWKQLLEILAKRPVHFHKVTGHSGVELNERADRLAQQAIQTLKR